MRHVSLLVIRCVQYVILSHMPQYLLTNSHKNSPILCMANDLASLCWLSSVRERYTETDQKYIDYVTDKTCGLRMLQCILCSIGERSNEKKTRHRMTLKMLICWPTSHQKKIWAKVNISMKYTFYEHQYVRMENKINSSLANYYSV